MAIPIRRLRSPGWRVVLLLAVAASLLLGLTGIALGAEAKRAQDDNSWGPATTSEVEVDVIVFATQTSGLAAAYDLLAAAPHLRVALVSCGNLLETPLAQGLSVEDVREADRVVGGFYDKWRRTLIADYRSRGISPFTGSGRLVYEPEMAAKALWSLLRAQDQGNLLFYSAHLVHADDRSERRYADLQVEGQGLLRVYTRFFIDASVEADLARALGADYRVGSHEAVYNDVAGVQPAYPTAANSYETAPQRFSPLLTLRVYGGAGAPRIAQLVHPNYDPVTYASITSFSQRNLDAFRSSWTMSIAVLPNGKREFNETWNDWPHMAHAFEWVFMPERRGEIRKSVLQWSINRVRYVQEHGYADVGIATIPQKLYVRQGPRVVGSDTYLVEELRTGVTRDPVAVGCYCEYDRHDWFAPNHVEQTAFARVPMGILMAKDHPWLLISTAVSTDYRTYSSAVRMEHLRSGMGGAAAAITVAADRSGVDPQHVSYGQVRALILEQGYRLEP